MTQDILTEKRGHAGIVTFNRPQALNALSHGMSIRLEQALDAWAADPAVAVVMIRAEGARAFCAGGDVAAIYHAGRAGDIDSGRAFWRDEYRMNAKIAEFPKPLVAFMQGFVMGGGVGVGGNANHRIVGETTQIAMPETQIGLVPDVGGSRLLSAAPGYLGEYLGLTGTRLGPGDALLTRFADHYVAESDWPALQQLLIDTGDARHLANAIAPAPEAPLAALRAEIDAAFSAPDLPAILARLEESGTPFAQATLSTLARMSPLSLALTLALIRAVRGRDIRRALETEFRITARAVEQADFLEGVRAQLIDKDRQPRWRHATAAEVDPAEVAGFLAPLAGVAGVNFGEPAPRAL